MQGDETRSHRRRVRTTLLELIEAIAATTRDDAEVVAIALRVLRRGRARPA